MLSFWTCPSWWQQSDLVGIRKHLFCLYVKVYWSEKPIFCPLASAVFIFLYLSWLESFHPRPSLSTPTFLGLLSCSRLSHFTFCPATEPPPPSAPNHHPSPPFPLPESAMPAVLDDANVCLSSRLIWRKAQSGKFHFLASGVFEKGVSAVWCEVMNVCSDESGCSLTWLWKVTMALSYDSRLPLCIFTSLLTSVCSEEI